MKRFKRKDEMEEIFLRLAKSVLQRIHINICNYFTSHEPDSAAFSGTAHAGEVSGLAMFYSLHRTRLRTRSWPCNQSIAEAGEARRKSETYHRS